jgi:hypothetical protein
MGVGPKFHSSEASSAYAVTINGMSVARPMAEKSATTWSHEASESSPDDRTR